MNYLENYSMKQLRELTEADLNKIVSPIKRKRKMYMFYLRVDKETVEYSEKGQVFPGVYATAWISDWRETTKEQYEEYVEYRENHRYDSLSSEYYDKEGITNAEIRELKYQNKLIDDIEFATKELKENPTLRNYNNLIKIKEFAMEVSFEYSNKLYELGDEYGVTFLEDKAIYFDKLTTNLRKDVADLKKEKEQFKAAKDKKENKDAIAKLKAEKERIEKELAEKLAVWGDKL